MGGGWWESAQRDNDKLSEQQQRRRRRPLASPSAAQHIRPQAQTGRQVCAGSLGALYCCFFAMSFSYAESERERQMSALVGAAICVCVCVCWASLIIKTLYMTLLQCCCCCNGNELVAFCLLFVYFCSL